MRVLQGVQSPAQEGLHNARSTNTRSGRQEIIKINAKNVQGALGLFCCCLAFVIVFAVLGVSPQALCVPGKCLDTEHTQLASPTFPSFLFSLLTLNERTRYQTSRVQCGVPLTACFPCCALNVRGTTCPITALYILSCIMA